MPGISGGSEPQLSKTIKTAALLISGMKAPAEEELSGGCPACGGMLGRANCTFLCRNCGFSTDSSDL